MNAYTKRRNSPLNRDVTPYRSFMLETARLRLRSLAASDVDIYHEIWGDREVIWWGASPDRETSAEKLAAVVDRSAAMPSGLGWWWLERLTDGVIVGDVFLQPASDPPGGIEVGWHLARAHWGNGYAQEGAALLLAHAWSLEFDEVTAPIVPTNRASVRLAERLGMERRGPPVEKGGYVHDVWVASRPGSETAVR